MMMRQMMLVMVLSMATGCSMSYSIGYPRVHTHVCNVSHTTTNSIPDEWWKLPIGTTTSQYYHCVSTLSWQGARSACLGKYARLLGHKDHTKVATVEYRRGTDSGWKHHFLVGKTTK